MLRGFECNCSDGMVKEYYHGRSDWVPCSECELGRERKRGFVTLRYLRQMEQLRCAMKRCEEKYDIEMEQL